MIDLKAIRKSLGETQDTFAKRFGVNQSTLQRWEVEGLPEHGTARLAVERVVADLQQLTAE